MKSSIAHSSQKPSKEKKYGSDKDVFQAVGSAADVGSNPHSMGGYLLHELFSHHLQSVCRAGRLSGSVGGLWRVFRITVIGFVFGVTAGAEAVKMLAVAFVVFIIPHITEWLIIRVAALNYGLRDFIKS